MLPRSVTDNRSLINAFLGFHLVAMVFWSQPDMYQPRTLINDITSGYMHFLGVWTAWDMFAPGPRTILIYMDATVTLRDGTQQTWSFPRMEQLGLYERLRNERFRKWAHDSVRMDTAQNTWEPAALYIARQFTDPDNPPVEVQLHRHWSYIPPPPETGSTIVTRPFEHFTFYSTSLVPGASH